MSKIALPAGVEPWEIPLLDIAECGVEDDALLELWEIEKPAHGIGVDDEYCA